jgi:hypothetical protein
VIDEPAGQIVRHDRARAIAIKVHIGYVPPSNEIAR